MCFKQIFNEHSNIEKARCTLCVFMCFSGNMFSQFVLALMDVKTAKPSRKKHGSQENMIKCGKY